MENVLEPLSMYVFIKYMCAFCGHASIEYSCQCPIATYLLHCLFRHRTEILCMANILTNPWSYRVVSTSDKCVRVRTCVV